MTDKLIRNFKKFGHISEEEEQAILASIDIKTSRKGEYILREGQNSQESYFVLKGCVRQFHLMDGEEKTTRFFMEDEWVISLPNADGSTVAHHNWVCMEDCTLVAGDEQKALELFTLFPDLEKISRKIVESAYSELQQNVLYYHSETAEQRYLKLQEKHPSIFQRIPQYHIASYIGVQPESLSRIRKRLAEKKS